MTRPRALAVIERAYRGSVEQQYAHVLWLVRSLQGQFDMSAFLRGTAALYALRNERSPTLALAGRPVLAALDYEATLRELLAGGVDVYVSAPSLRRLGAMGRTLIDGVRPVEDSELASLCAAHDRFWFL